MSDIFISYKREDQATARKLADALEKEGLSVWWDPKLRAGEHFDDVIEKALNDAKCVIVMWSNLSVNSEYVKAEATEALEQKKLVPIKIESVNLPFRFKRVHTLSLLGWDGSKDFPEFRRLVEDISETVGRPKPGTIFCDKLKDGSQGPAMVVIPAGTFQMGDINGDRNMWERPVHIVRIIRPLAIGRYEITFEEYDQFAVATDRQFPRDEDWGRGRLPVIDVSWEHAIAYAEWLSEQTGQHYRLPSEAEWEYAARAGTKTAYWWGNEILSGMANYPGGRSRSSEEQTATVGSFKPNPFGLYDTAGNVFEWVQDYWHDNYNCAPDDGSAWTSGGFCEVRVIRGGSWFNPPEYASSSSRYSEYTDCANFNIGFRLARDIV
jgi:formylglycine-generating enzyme required for sulfatase activity